MLVSRWNEQIGDSTLADGILDRLVYKPSRLHPPNIANPPLGRDSDEFLDELGIPCGYSLRQFYTRSYRFERRD